MIKLLHWFDLVFIGIGGSLTVAAYLNRSGEK